MKILAPFLLVIIYMMAQNRVFMYQPPPGYAVVTVSLAIVHRQADFTPPSLRDTSPKNFSNFQRRSLAHS